MAEIRSSIETAKREAATIASSGVTAVHSDVVDAFVQANAGKSVQGYQWVSILDGRTSDLCRPRAGLRFLADGSPVGHDRPFLRPPIHQNCRSSLIPWLIDVRDMPRDLQTRVNEAGRGGAMSGKAAPEPTLDEFLKSRSEAEQISLLGAKQHALWKSGRITQAGLLDQSSRPLTLAQLRKALGLE